MINELNDLITQFTSFFVFVAPSPSSELLLSKAPANRKTNYDGSLSRVFLHDLFKPSINMLLFLLPVTLILYLNVCDTIFFTSQTSCKTFTLAENHSDARNKRPTGPLSS